MSGGSTSGGQVTRLLVRLEDVTKRYDDGRFVRTVLDHVHLELVEGESVSLMGAS